MTKNWHSCSKIINFWNYKSKVALAKEEEQLPHFRTKEEDSVVFVNYLGKLLRSLAAQSWKVSEQVTVAKTRLSQLLWL